MRKIILHCIDPADNQITSTAAEEVDDLELKNDCLSVFKKNGTIENFNWKYVYGFTEVEPKNED